MKPPVEETVASKHAEYSEFRADARQAARSDKLGCATIVGITALVLAGPAAAGFWLSTYCGPIGAAACAIFLVWAEAATWMEFEDWWTRRQLARARPTCVRDAREGLVRVRGKIVPGRSGTVRSPCSGHEAVWIQLLTEKMVAAGRSTGWTKLLNEEASRDMFIDDGSGDLAWIDVSKMSIVGEPGSNRESSEAGWKVFDSHLHTEEYERDDQRYERFNQRFGSAMDRYLGQRVDPEVLTGMQSLRVTERCLRPGDVVSVVGVARRERPPTQPAKDSQHASVMITSGKKERDDVLVFVGREPHAGLSKILAPLALAVLAAAVGVASSHH